MFNPNETFSKNFKHRRNFKKWIEVIVSKSDKLKAEFVKEKFLRKSKPEDSFTEAPSTVLQNVTILYTQIVTNETFSQFQIL